MSIHILDITTEEIDGVKRHVLDSTDKIVRWIRCKMQEQQKLAIDKRSAYEPVIDLSNCILSTNNSIFNLLAVIKHGEKNDLSDYLHLDSDDNKIIACKFYCKNSIFSEADFGETIFRKTLNSLVKSRLSVSLF